MISKHKYSPLSTSASNAISLTGNRVLEFSTHKQHTMQDARRICMSNTSISEPNQNIDVYYDIVLLQIRSIYFPHIFHILKYIFYINCSQEIENKIKNEYIFYLIGARALPPTRYCMASTVYWTACIDFLFFSIYPKAQRPRNASLPGHCSLYLLSILCSYISPIKNYTSVVNIR